MERNAGRTNSSLGHAGSGSSRPGSRTGSVASGD
jgi:hypothetical protein